MQQTSPDGRVADATKDNWVDRFAPKGTRPYLRLSRADRPAGTWLLLIPCWWGAALAVAASGEGWSLASLWVMVGCAIGAFLMRGAGCTWNDLTDQEFDAAVARTKSRPLPSGQVTRKQAKLWMLVQTLIAGAVLLTFHMNAILLGLGSLFLVVIYPFAKRFTWWPQVFLGLAFNWGALLGWTAVTGSLSDAPVLLYVCGIAWTIFYDTIYAHQDKDDDALIGVKSTARLFAGNTRPILTGFGIVTIALLTAATFAALGGPLSSTGAMLAYVGCIGMALHLIWQLRVLDIDNPDNCLFLFRANMKAGLIYAVPVVVAGLL